MADRAGRGYNIAGAGFILSFEAVYGAGEVI